MGFYLKEKTAKKIYFFDKIIEKPLLLN